jgi:hypothetical protein
MVAREGTGAAAKPWLAYPTDAAAPGNHHDHDHHHINITSSSSSKHHNHENIIK